MSQGQMGLKNGLPKWTHLWEEPGRWEFMHVMAWFLGNQLQLRIGKNEMLGVFFPEIPVLLTPISNIRFCSRGYISIVQPTYQLWSNSTWPSIPKRQCQPSPPVYHTIPVCWRCKRKASALVGAAMVVARLRLEPQLLVGSCGEHDKGCDDKKWYRIMRDDKGLVADKYASWIYHRYWYYTSIWYYVIVK